MCLQKLPTTARYCLLRPEELVSRLVIREATAEVISRGCHHSESRRDTAPFTMAALRYSGPKFPRTSFSRTKVP